MQETISWDSEISIRDNPIEVDLPMLFPLQQENVRMIEERFKVGKGRMITDGTGTGKAQPLYSKVATTKGFVKMSDLTYKDKVIGYDGKPKKILGIFPQGIKKVYKVIFQDGTSTECCEEHLWETQTLRERRNNLKRSYNKSSSNNNPDKWNPKVRSLKEIMNTLEERHFLPVVKAVKYRKKNFSIDPYLLGVLLGDGCLKNSSYIVTSEDPEIIDNCNLPTTDSFVVRNSKNRTIGYKIKGVGFRNEKGHPVPSLVQQFCKKFDLDGKGSLNKFVPEQYMYGSIEQRLALLQGLMDTDGNVSKGKASFCSISIKLANAVAEIVRSLGGTASVNYKNMGNYHDAYIVQMNVPVEFNPFKLKRKADKYKPSIKYFPKKVIVDVQFLKETECQCIYIDCRKRLYVTDNYILTHNTFTGLGVIKRFQLKGKNNIIIVVPTDDKAKDWVKEGMRLSIYITQLEGIHDMGNGVRVTTYANFYQNNAVLKEVFDLVVYDESHYIMQNGQGKETSCMGKHKLICCLPSVAKERARHIIGEPPYNPESPNDLNYDQSKELDAYYDDCKKVAKRIYQITKVLFLSATPFAYHKSIKYADGLLWDIEEIWDKEPHFYGYNQASGFEKFLCDNFGYTMKNNRCTKPDVDVNVGLLEREFFEKAKKQNLMSTNILDVNVDYSRHFIKVDSDLGFKMDEFLNTIYSIQDKRFQRLHKIFRKHFSYVMTSKILESAKAENIVERIHFHLMIERKVVLFHGFNNVSIPYPFYIQDCKRYLKAEEKHWAYSLNQILESFYKAYPEWKEYDLQDLKSVPEIVKSFFKDRCGVYNGTVSKKKRREIKDSFMDDNSGVDVIVIQSQAGKEGISLHDVTGERQRVSIDLSLPVRPTESIQKEGRIYRHGVQSNAIYEYPTLQTNMERMVFAYTVAERAKTVENLAMGNLARDLETAFKSGYENFEEGPPNIVQGRLGKKEDKKIQYTVSPFEKSLTYYYQKQKANSKKKNHNDYFATPEPLGFKMVEWCKTKDNLRWLEPSCGDGSIARFFPENSVRKVLDVDYGLLSICKLKSNVETYHMDFMDYKIHNKFDRIIMNPPFGYGGKTAVEHLLKALIHLDKRGNAKLYCILPIGSSCEKHFERMVQSENMKFFNYTGEILLPGCTFKKAGTKTMTRIVRFEGTNIHSNFRSIDFTAIDKINDLFEAIKDLNF